MSPGFAGIDVRAGLISRLLKVSGSGVTVSVKGCSQCLAMALAERSVPDSGDIAGLPAMDDLDKRAAALLLVDGMRRLLGTASACQYPGQGRFREGPILTVTATSTATTRRNPWPSQRPCPPSPMLR